MTEDGHAVAQAVKTRSHRVAQVACLQATRVASPEEVEVIRPIDWARLNSDFCRLGWQLLVAMPPR